MVAPYGFWQLFCEILICLCICFPVLKSVYGQKSIYVHLLCESQDSFYFASSVKSCFNVTTHSFHPLTSTDVWHDLVNWPLSLNGRSGGFNNDHFSYLPWPRPSGLQQCLSSKSRFFVSMLNSPGQILGGSYENFEYIIYLVMKILIYVTRPYNIYLIKTNIHFEIYEFSKRSTLVIIHHTAIFKSFFSLFTQVNARTELALRYNDISPLENHHCSVAFQILEKVNKFLILPLWMTTRRC